MTVKECAQDDHTPQQKGAKFMNYYLQDVSNFTDPKDDEGVLFGIPKWRKEKILSYASPSDRKLSLGAWRLLEKSLQLHGASAINVTVGANGKLQCSGVQFNLSHSGSLVLCAVGEGAIGCDIELVKDNAPFKVAERYFSEKEREYVLDTANASEKCRRFYRLWTMKESYLKMSGEGICLSPAHIEIDLNTLSVLRDNTPMPCKLQNFSYGNYEISICEK
jgi:4'-phosphopantetheinyl transferase